MKLFAFTLDLESDYAGLINEYNIFKDPDKIEEVLSALNALGVKTTVFAVGEIFEQFPEIIKLFEKYNCEFEPHSYSHNFNHPDSEDEIKKAKAAYKAYFQKDPTGYRAPRGMISSDGIMNLERHGFLYDSSIFPSFFPNPFKYLLSNKEPHCYGDSSMLEIPLTSVSPFRLTLSISYIKLLGINIFRFFSLPDVICFDSHLHDFIVNDISYKKLSPTWHFIYSHNKFNGLELCIKFVEHIKQKGYKFCYMSELYNSYKKDPAQKEIIN